ncbi:MAG: hypothetical protein HY681_15505 [Chloroflexi bacterium]|nr:hypothetical protein [Chloroflexota bacterium]
MMSKRSSAEIVYEVLCAPRGRAVNKKTIAYSSRVSDRQASRYISLLCAGRLLERTPEGVYRVTPAGEAARVQLENALVVLRDLVPEQGKQLYA